MVGGLLLGRNYKKRRKREFLQPEPPICKFGEAGGRRERKREEKGEKGERGVRGRRKKDMEG